MIRCQGISGVSSILTKTRRDRQVVPPLTYQSVPPRFAEVNGAGLAGTETMMLDAFLMQ